MSGMFEWAIIAVIVFLFVITARDTRQLGRDVWRGAVIIGLIVLLLWVLGRR